MLKANWSVFRILLNQIGMRRAWQITLMKGLRKLLSPGSNFHYAQTGEDLILQYLIEKYLDKKVITYIDVGCHDPIKISSTYLHYLHGSCGLAIDMGESYFADFKRERPKDVFICAAVSDVAGQAYMHEFSAPEVNTICTDQAEIWKGYWKSKGQKLVKTYPLGELVTTHFPDKKIDVLLLDVEGHELQVLQGANLPRLNPQLVVCEIHGLNLMHITENSVAAFLIDNGYSLVSYATMNAYFLRDSPQKLKARANN